MGGYAYVGNQEEKTFDNFYKCEFSYGGYTWNSVEQAYQAMKFSDKNHINIIRSEDNIAMIYFLGNVKYIAHTEEWVTNSTDEKIRLMYEINKAKFSHNSDLKKKLLSNNEEIEFRGNRFWGKKGKTGSNWCGKILSKIRDELRDEQPM